MSGEGSQLLVLYATETGTAEEVAQRIVRECRRNHIPVKCRSVAHFDIRSLIQFRYVAWVASTTGDGDPPGAFVQSWRFLCRRSLPADSLAHMAFAVVGLGDSSYPRYCTVAKRLRKRLLQLGAAELLPMCLADDQHALGVDGAVDPWLPSFLLVARQIFPSDKPPVPDTELLPPSVRVARLGVQPAAAGAAPAPPPAGPPTRDAPFLARLTTNCRQTAAEHFQDVRHLSFDISGSGIEFAPGDVAHIMPQSPAAVVEELLDWLELDPHEHIRVEPRAGASADSSADDLPAFFRTRSTRTLRDVFTHYLNAVGPPSRYFFELLSFFATAEHETEKLREFASTAGQDDLYAYCHRPRRTILEVLHDFPSTRGHIPLDYIFDLFKPLQPRAFSIASSQLSEPSSLELCVAVVRYKTLIAAPREGLCSTWLASLDPTSPTPPAVPLWVTKGTFPQTPLEHPDLPLVMIGPGTGCAPFRSFLQHRLAIGAKDNALFFGNRNRDGDFLFQEEWEAAAASGALQLFTAFSRDQPEKIYVQHVLRTQSALLWRCLSSGGFIFLAGRSVSMPTEVRAAIVEAIAEGASVSEDEAAAMFAKFQTSRHFCQETWG